jgi:glycosyltransferase involved in cell wall biosynthesis
MNNLILVIPIYQPSVLVLPFLKSIAPSDFQKVVVVDDGSGETYQPIFQSVADFPNFELISYPTNGGKGHALKTAFDYIKKMHPEASGVVTADGDGQHALTDILKVRDALLSHPTSLVLGVRDFHGKDVPKHNKMGNRFSAAYFHLATGVKLGDTQTGLRGIPKNLFPLALESKGERYEYEMNFLLEAVKEAPLVQIGIQTIYDGNKSSHFHPFRDSARIYKTPLIYILVSLLSWVIDLGLFTLFIAVGPDETLYKILVGTIGARLISGSFNFTMNYFFVFDSKGDLRGKLLRYAVVFFINMALSFGLTYAFNALPANLTFIKFVVDFILFTVNYFVSRSWIFAKKMTAKKKAAKEAALHKEAHL